MVSAVHAAFHGYAVEDNTLRVTFRHLINRCRIAFI